MDRPLDPAGDGQFLGNDIALHLRAVGDQDGRGVYLALDTTKNLDDAVSDKLADNRHAGADRRDLFHRLRFGRGLGDARR